MEAQLLLASGSPRRLQLLRQLGLEPEVLAADIDESQAVNEGWQAYVVRMAIEKAKAGSKQSGALVTLGADTCVIVDEQVLGKPKSEDDAMRMLLTLSGRQHQVATAVAVVTASGESSEALNISNVSFAQIPEKFIRAYIASGEPMDKAGAYAVQGKIAAYIERLDGSYSGVMGLPLFETAQLLGQADICEY